MTRKPLPDDFNVQAFNAAEIMVMREQQVGIPLRATINVEPLHDLMRLFVVAEDQAHIEHLIIIDDETADLLKNLMWTTVARLRPERATPGHNIGVTSRSVAIDKLDGDLPAGVALAELEVLLFDTAGVEEVIFEDADDAEYGAAMTRLTSGRSHGRSPALD